MLALMRGIFVIHDEMKTHCPNLLPISCQENFVARVDAGIIFGAISGDCPHIVVPNDELQLVTAR